MGAVEQKDSFLCGDFEYIDAIDEPELMTGDEVGPADQVGRANGLRSETKMGDRFGTGFLRVIDEIALGVYGGIVADNLY